MRFSRTAPSFHQLHPHTHGPPVGRGVVWGVTGLEPGYRAKLVMPTYAGGSQGTVVNLLRVDFPTSDVLFRLLGGSAIG